MSRVPSDLPLLAPEQIADFWRAGQPPPGVLRLLTVQDDSAWERLGRGERLTGSPRFVADEDVPAYGWMSVQLERLGWHVRGAPVWAWQRVRFERLVSTWPEGVADDIVVMVVDVPRSRALLSAFDPWQELFDEETDGAPSPRWLRVFDVADYPDSAIQATLPFLEIDDLVRACRLRL